MKDFDTLPAHFATVLGDADELQLFQLDSGRKFLSAHLDDYALTRTFAIETEAQKRDFAAAVAQGIAESEDHARCFFPHHGLRARRGEQVLEMVICFQCDWIRAVLGEEEVSFATSRRAEILFDSYFLACAASRNLSRRIQDMNTEIHSYSLPIPARLEKSFASIEELQRELQAQPELEDHDRMEARLEELKNTLHERARF